MSGADFPVLRRAVADTAVELDRVRARVAELQPAESGADDAEAGALDAAREAVGDARAAALLGDGDNTAVQAAEQALQAAQAAHQQARARTAEQTAVQAGLQRLQGKAATAHQAAEQALQAALLEWVQAEHAQSDAQYIQHVRAAGAAAVRTQALNVYMQGRGRHVPCAADLRHFRWVPSEVFTPPSPSALYDALQAELAALGTDERPRRSVTEGIKALTRRVTA